MSSNASSQSPAIASIYDALADVYCNLAETYRHQTDISDINTPIYRSINHLRDALTEVYNNKIHAHVNDAIDEISSILASRQG